MGYAIFFLNNCALCSFATAIWTKNYNIHVKLLS